MKIYIDESGNFVEGSQWGLVCSLALPHKEVGPARRKLGYLTRAWPRQNGELKGGLLEEAHLIQLVELLFQRSALMHVCAIHVAGEDFAKVENHKAGQCDGLTCNLTDEHHPDLVAEVWKLRRTLEQMPTQLYMQCTLQSELVRSVVEDCTMYFAQRRPKEIASFEWIVDAKDPLHVSTQERWWRDTLGPFLQSATMRRPWGLVHDGDFDYSYFDKAFRYVHDQWYPDRPREKVEGFDITQIITRQLTFADSRSDVLLQAADVLANFMRRVLAGIITDKSAIGALGRLQIYRRAVKKGPLQSVHLLSLSRSETYSGQDSARLQGVLRTVTSTGRRMILHSDR